MLDGVPKGAGPSISSAAYTQMVRVVIAERLTPMATEFTAAQPLVFYAAASTDISPSYLAVRWLDAQGRRCTQVIHAMPLTMAADLATRLNRAQREQPAPDAGTAPLDLAAQLETERTMHRAWRKRAEEAESREMPLIGRSLTAVERESVDAFRREMQEHVIPEIVNDVRRRAELAQESRSRLLGGPVDAGTGEARTICTCSHSRAAHLPFGCEHCICTVFQPQSPAPLDLAAVLTNEVCAELLSVEDPGIWERSIPEMRRRAEALLTPWLASREMAEAHRDRLSREVLAYMQRSAESAQQIAELEAQVTSLCNADAERVRMVSEWRLRSQEWEQDAKRSNARLAEVAQAARALRRDANRLCDRMLGGTYEADMRRTIAEADAVLSRLPATGEGPAK